MPKNVIILGAGGHARVIADIIIKSGETLLGFLDDGIEGEVMGLPILGKISDLENYEDASFVIGIGNGKTREQIAEKHSVNWYTAIHPNAVIGCDVTIDEGTVVMAGAVINTGACIGRHCIINTSAVVEHDNIIEGFTHISVGAKLAGMVHIGKRVWVGIGAIVNHNLSICDNCIIGAGAVVIKNVMNPGVYIGIPAGRVK
ncbi:MAG TPA: acetyltransferase [Clostridiales bacterium]|nr:acetyltransferase [Clostridiales bacterium]